MIEWGSCMVQWWWYNSGHGKTYGWLRSWVKAYHFLHWHSAAWQPQAVAQQEQASAQQALTGVAMVVCILVCEGERKTSKFLGCRRNWGPYLCTPGAQTPLHFRSPQTTHDLLLQKHVRRYLHHLS